MSEIAITNILLVEDDEVDVMSIKRSFKKSNVANSLFVANNGWEGLAILRNQSETVQMPEERRLVLLDLNMPKMSGLQFLTELRADEKLRRTPVTVLTTSDQECDRIEAYNLNVAGYVLKPVTFSEFSNVILTLNRYWTLCEIP